MLALAVQPNQRDFAAAQEQILPSFRLLTPNELSSMRDRLVQSFDAKPLPQQPSINKRKTDAEDENLRGRVKGVLTEREPYFEGTLLDVRTPVAANEFDERGYLMREIQYADEIPISVTSYGYLNGARTMRKVIKADSAFIRKVAGELNALRNTIEITREMRSRYVDPGLLAETSTYDRDGQVVERKFFKHAGSKRETEIWEYFKLFTIKTHSHSKVIETLDDKGNAIEATEMTFQELPAYYSTTGTTSSEKIEKKVTEEKFAHSYEYDSHGNWIRRDTFVLTNDKRFPRKPLFVTYRSITYY